MKKKEGNNRVSNYLHTLRENDKLEVRTPQGSFYYRENKQVKNVVLIGAGSGISSMLAMAKYIKGKKI